MPDMPDMQGLAKCSVIQCAGLRNVAVNTLTLVPGYLLVALHPGINVNVITATYMTPACCILQIRHIRHKRCRISVYNNAVSLTLMHCVTPQGLQLTDQWPLHTNRPDSEKSFHNNPRKRLHRLWTCTGKTWQKKNHSLPKRCHEVHEVLTASINISPQPKLKAKHELPRALPTSLMPYLALLQEPNTIF